MSLFFLHYLIFLSRYLSVDFFGIFKIKFNSIFLLLRLCTRYLSVKAPVRFDIWGLLNINLSIFIVFCNIKLHFFYFSYFFILRYKIFVSEIAFPFLMPP